MKRIWWKIVLLLSLFNIVLFAFHFVVLFVSDQDTKCEKDKMVVVGVAHDKSVARHNNPTLMKRQGSIDDIGVTRIGRSWSAKKLDKEKFTIIILTHGRTSVLLGLLGRYIKSVASGKLPQLSKILVVWNNIRTEPPTKKLGLQTVPVVFLKQKENRLTNRFRVFPEIDTEAIFTQDDDIYASPLDLKYSFSLSKKFPTKLVGFYARKHEQRSDGSYLYSTNPRHNIYSMILTGACFVHIAFLEMFQNQPKSILDTIDELMNGEDIAMNMMIANYTKEASGYFVKPVFLGTINSVVKSGQALHDDNDHITKRSRCINEMTKFYGMPLQFTDIAFQQYLYTWKDPSKTTVTNSKKLSKSTKIHVVSDT